MARCFNSDPTSYIICNVGQRSDSIDWQQFLQFLLQRMTSKTAQDRMRYAKQYASILLSGSYQTSSSLSNSGLPQLLQLSPNKRIHVMKALSCLAKFTGCYDSWTAMCRKYQLNWSTGTEKIDAFTRFFDDSRSLDTMLHWLREALQALPASYSRFLLFCTITGLRGSEAIESVRLLHINTNMKGAGNTTSPLLSTKQKEERTTHTHSPSRTTQSLHSRTTMKLPQQLEQYYNPEQQILCHYLYPDLFIRRTKAVYISVVNDEIIRMARGMEKPPTINGLKMAIRHSCPSMQLKYCRKIYASWLHKCGISDPLIDMLQGRIGKNIFLKHYLTPSSNYKAQVLKALEKLQRQL